MTLNIPYSNPVLWTHEDVEVMRFRMKHNNTKCDFIEKSHNDRIDGKIFHRSIVNNAEIYETLIAAVEWWLLEGRKQFYGAPAWVFKARELLDNPTKDT